MKKGVCLNKKERGENWGKEGPDKKNGKKGVKLQNVEDKERKGKSPSATHHPPHRISIEYYQYVRISSSSSTGPNREKGRGVGQKQQCTTQTGFLRTSRRLSSEPSPVDALVELLEHAASVDQQPAPATAGGLVLKTAADQAYDADRLSAAPDVQHVTRLTSPCCHRPEPL